MQRSYVHGHGPSVLKSHRWRNLDNSVALLRPHLKTNSHVLECGCGPGTIIADIAGVCYDGHAVGIDAEPSIIEAAAAEFPTVTFKTGDIKALEFDDESFDIVFCHQVLQHVDDPLRAISEMSRVCKPNGIIMAKEIDHDLVVFSPDNEGMRLMVSALGTVVERNGGDPTVGRKLLKYAQDSGLTDIRASASAWCFAKEEERKWWGELWAERCVNSCFADQMEELGVATTSERERMAADFLKWSECKDGIMILMHCEILCKK